VSADAWIVYDLDSGGKLLAGKLPNFKREIASLTKMMTFLVSWQLFQKYFPEQHTLQIQVPKYCT
jgi:D-alanyl-D-alanine carboxypeptidase